MTCRVHQDHLCCHSTTCICVCGCIRDVVIYCWFHQNPFWASRATEGQNLPFSITLVSCILQNEMVMFAGDMNGHIGISNVGYDGTHGGFGYGSRNTDGSRILEFADGLNLVVCNTLFTKQEAKLVTYVAVPVKSTVDYIMVWQEDKAKVRKVKVISSEECVPKHKLLVLDMRFNARKCWHRKFEPECVYGSSRRKRHVTSMHAWLEIR